ncbi:hypothetical protein ALC62_07960, partial [Cyphomyrmex costatus]
ITVQLALPRDTANYDSIVSETRKSHIPRRVLPSARIEESSSLSSSIIGTVWLNEFQLSKLGSVALARNMFDSVPIMRCLFMLQILIAVVQPNLEAQQRLFNVRGTATTRSLRLNAILCPDALVCIGVEAESDAVPSIPPRGTGKGHIVVVGGQTREVPLAREKFPRVV